MALASVSQVGIAMAYGNPDTGPGCGLGKLAWADLSGKKISLRKYSWRRRMEPLGVRPSGLVSGHPAAPMMEKSERTIKPSSLWQPRLRIWQGICHAIMENTWLRWRYYSTCRQTISRCSIRWRKNAIASSLAVERPHRVRLSRRLMRLWQDIRLWLESKRRTSM